MLCCQAKLPAASYPGCPQHSVPRAPRVERTAKPKDPGQEGLGLQNWNPSVCLEPQKGENHLVCGAVDARETLGRTLAFVPRSVGGGCYLEGFRQRLTVSSALQNQSVEEGRPRKGCCSCPGGRGLS